MIHLLLFVLQQTITCLSTLLMQMSIYLHCSISNTDFLFLPQIYPSLLEQPRPCLPPQERWRRRRRRTQRSQQRDSLLSPRNISGPTQPNPNAFTSVVDLSSAVFRYEPFKKTEPFQEGDGDLKPSFPFWRAESASSQLVLKLSLVKTISPVPPMPHTLKGTWERRHFQRSMRS